MPLRKFEIEWPNEHGSLWMNTSNLLTCLVSKCPNTQFIVRDVTGDGEANGQWETGEEIQFEKLNVEK